MGSFQTLYLGARLYADHRELAGYERVDPDDPALAYGIADGSPVDVIYFGPEESLADSFHRGPAFGGPRRDRHIERVPADSAAEQYTVVLSAAEVVDAYLDADMDSDRYLLWLEGEYQETMDDTPGFQIGFLGAGPDVAAHYSARTDPTVDAPRYGRQR